MRSYFDAVCARFGLGGRAALLPESGRPYGMCFDDVAGAVARADVLVNLSGRWREHDLAQRIPVRAYVDLDPAFTQFWHAQGSDVGLSDHTHHLTVGAGIAGESSPVPTAGVEWRAILPPVVLDHWPAQPPPAEPLLTTVANWRSYGSIEHDGRQYGQKAHAYRSPRRAARRQPCADRRRPAIHPGDDVDRKAPHRAGWRLLDPVDRGGRP